MPNLLRLITQFGPKRKNHPPKCPSWKHKMRQCSYLAEEEIARKRRKRSGMALSRKNSFYKMRNNFTILLVILFLLQSACSAWRFCLLQVKKLKQMVTVIWQETPWNTFHPWFLTKSSSVRAETFYWHEHQNYCQRADWQKESGNERNSSDTQLTGGIDPRLPDV